MHFLGQLTTQLSAFKKPLLPGMDIKIQLHRVNDAVALFTGPSANMNQPEADAWTANPNYTYHVEIEHCSLFLHRLQISDKLYSQHKAKLSKQVARYYSYVPQSSFMNVSPGVLDFTSQALFPPSVMPVKLFLVFFKNSTLQGSYTENVQCYHRPPNLKSISIDLDGQPLSTFRNAYFQDLDKAALDFFYLSLFQTLQTEWSNFGPPVTREKFLSDFFVCSWSTTTSGVERQRLPLVRTGTLTLRVQFKTPSEENLTALVFGTCPMLLTVSGNYDVETSLRI